MSNVTVYRLIEYQGPQEWVAATLARSLEGKWQAGSAEHPASITARQVTLLAGTALVAQMEQARDWPCVWEGRQGPRERDEEV